MKINNIEVLGNEFAWDGCHKIYILETPKDKEEAVNMGYIVYPLKSLKAIYKKCCSLRFINSWDLNTTYVDQFTKGEIK